MNILSVTARRFISLAIATLGDAHRAQVWHSWDAAATSDAPPPYVAQIAIHALSNYAIHLEDRILGMDDAAEAAQIENDLGYVADIERFLAQSLQSAEPQLV
jgi:hypothetical protein